MMNLIEATCIISALVSGNFAASIRGQRSSGQCNLSSQWPPGYKVFCDGASEYICGLYPYCDWGADASPPPPPTGDEKCLTRPGYEGFEGYCSPQDTEDASGVDCGGVCPACAPIESCSDSIQNQDETGVDCGGVCAPCPTPATCDDGIQNQDEESTDCGG
eukprot:Awhi_evm1s1288